MNNHFILLGRVTDICNVDDITLIKLAISKYYKNENGDNETIFINVTTKGEIAKNVNEYLENGDFIGVKGFIENNNILIADKLSFLSSKKEEV